MAAGGAEIDGDRVGLGVPARVRHRLLDDPEQVARHVRRHLDALDRRHDLEAVASPPDRDAVLHGLVEAELLKGVGPEIDDLVPERPDVAGGELACLLDQGRRLLVVPPSAALPAAERIMSSPISSWTGPS